MTKYVAIVKIRGSLEPPIVLKIGKYPNGTAAVAAFASETGRWMRILSKKKVEETVICPADDKAQHLADFREARRRPH
jgi:hypothetical protein